MMPTATYQELDVAMDQYLSQAVLRRGDDLSAEQHGARAHVRAEPHVVRDVGVPAHSEGPARLPQEFLQRVAGWRPVGVRYLPGRLHGSARLDRVDPGGRPHPPDVRYLPEDLRGRRPRSGPGRPILRLARDLEASTR
eukprot:8078839-Pyramimonas_sp.AAC.1